MTYAYRLDVVHGDLLTRLESLRQTEAAYREMTELLSGAENVWNSSGQTFDERRDSCTAVVAALALFAKRFGVSSFTDERLNDICVALGELTAGRTSDLLQRSDRPTRTPAATDFMNQAVAQVCVDLLRIAGVSAKDAWARTARLFAAKGFKNFSVHKIRALGPRLSGAGASMDPAYEQYQLIQDIARNLVKTRQRDWPPSESLASAVARYLVGKASDLDHRLAA